jgi:hypothetical protein
MARGHLGKSWNNLNTKGMGSFALKSFLGGQKGKRGKAQANDGSSPWTSLRATNGEEPSRGGLMPQVVKRDVGKSQMKGWWTTNIEHSFEQRFLLCITRHAIVTFPGHQQRH